MPVLVADDDSALKEGIKTVCKRGATFWGNRIRLGHISGDLSVLWKGLSWAIDLGIDFIAKLSQRYLITEPRWLQNGVKKLRDADGALLGQWDTISGCIRTECMLLSVQKWKSVIRELEPKKVYGNTVESFVGKVLQEINRPLVLWELLGTGRHDKTDGVMWHCANTEEDYKIHAAHLGIELGPDFTCKDWWEHSGYIPG